MSLNTGKAFNGGEWDICRAFLNVVDLREASEWKVNSCQLQREARKALHYYTVSRTAKDTAACTLLQAMTEENRISSREFRKRVLDICSSSLHLTAESLPCTMQLPKKSKTRNDYSAPKSSTATIGSKDVTNTVLTVSILPWACKCQDVKRMKQRWATSNDLQAKCPQSTRMVCLHA